MRRQRSIFAEPRTSRPNGQRVRIRFGTTTRRTQTCGRHLILPIAVPIRLRFPHLGFEIESRCRFYSNSDRTAGVPACCQWSHYRGIWLVLVESFSHLLRPGESRHTAISSANWGKNKLARPSFASSQAFEPCPVISCSRHPLD